MNKIHMHHFNAEAGLPHLENKITGVHIYIWGLGHQHILIVKQSQLYRFLPPQFQNC
jgi:hypothetical protein